MTVEPVAPAYPFAAPGADVELFRGDIRILGSAGPGRIWFDTNRGGFRWQFDEYARTDLTEGTLAFGHPARGAVEVPARATSSSGTGVLLPGSLGAPAALDEAVVHWLNVPRLSSAGVLASGQGTWLGRWEGRGGGWAMTMDERIDHASAFAQAKAADHGLITHTGLLRRTDGRSFSPDEATGALRAWQACLSFALGRWVAPALAVGYREGARAWELWSPWRLDAIAGLEAWWDTARDDDLDEFAALFLAAWHSPGQHDRTRYFAHHVIESNEPAMTLEARVMLAGAAVEYLSWVRHVVTGGRSRTAHEKRKASENLRELLEEAAIPADVPSDLTALEQARAELGLLDAPETIAWLRNRLVHPKDAAEPYRLEHLVLQAWQLLIQWAELLLLHDLRHTGAFCPRFPPGRWAHDSEPVPWARRQGAL